MYNIRDNFLTVRDNKKIAKSKKFLRKGEETVVKFSAQSENFSVLVVKGLTNLLLFRLVFWLFRNTKTPCFDIKAKQPKQTSIFGQCRNQFRFHFRLFRYETSFGGHPSWRLKSRLFKKSCLFKGQRIQQGSNRNIFQCCLKKFFYIS